MPQPTRASQLLRTGNLAFGADYNPEQWPEEVWEEDVRLMKEAGVNLVSVGVFAWALLEPAEGAFDFGFLDRVLDRLHDAGIAAVLATPTASPPAWFTKRYPDARLTNRAGQVLGFGARQALCPSSPDYRRLAVRVAERLAARYGEHPALALWHVHNEYGGFNPACYCETSASAFRAWLRDRYGDLARLNDAWGTAFWGQRYHEWEEIDPPRLAPAPVNPAQQLDYRRFSNDEHLACYRLERDALRRVTPDVPLTTNFMTGNHKDLDYWRWAAEVDVVGTCHYLKPEAPDNHVDLAMTADLSRSLGGGHPWLLMEHSTGAINWQPRNLAKTPGQMRRNSLAHVARGADGVMFFQWRASRAGSEKFHSAMLPQGGTSTRIWQDVTRLGAEVGALAEVRGSVVRADAAMVWDWQSWWALELEHRPTIDLSYRDRTDAFYEALWREHVTVDFAAPAAPLGAYPLVVVPSLYLMTTEAADVLRGYVEGGGHLLVSYFSGIVDEADRVHPGAYPGALREVLGLTVEEFHPLRAGETVGIAASGAGELRGSVWSEAVRLEGAEAVWRYTGGPDAGEPAVTCHAFGRGRAWYVSTRLDVPGIRRLLPDVLAAAGVQAPDLPEGVEVVRRHGTAATYLFAINHGTTPTEVPATGTDLLTGTHHHGRVPLPPSGVAVIRESR